MGKNITIASIVAALFGGLLYVIFLPPLNLQSSGFWWCMIAVAVVWAIVYHSANFIADEDSCTFLNIATIGIPVALVVIFIIGALSGSAMFASHGLANVCSDRIEKKFMEEYEPSLDSVPLMDKNTAVNLAQRKMGTLTEYVSQYEIIQSNQINLGGKAVRVAPLGYASFWKWNANKLNGIPAYILTDMSTQETTFVEIEGGMKYSTSAFWSTDVIRTIRKQYPCEILGTPIFEIDEDGAPYWVVPVFEHTVGMFNGKEIQGVIKLDACSGNIEYYAMGKIPSYIDNVYPTGLIISQYDNYGTLSNGFWNSLFAQRGCIVTTEGYNYIPHNDDVYIYTGVTSVVSDESNIGFIFANKRTGEIEYYECAGAEEYSAMASAEGVVQHLGYNATFPLLLNIDGEPSYLMTLKDNAGLVKMYSFVNVREYQIVVVENSLEDALNAYLEAIGKKLPEPEIEQILANLTGVVDDIRQANIEGTTIFYVQVNGTYYALSCADNEEVVLLNVGDTVTIQYPEDTTTKIVDGYLK